MTSNRNNKSGLIFISILTFIIVAAFGALVMPDHQLGNHDAAYRPKPQALPQSMLAQTAKPAKIVKQASLDVDTLSTER